MGRFSQIVIGPAGSGKSTYCLTLYNYFLNCRRKISFINLDPAVEKFEYPVQIDIRDLVTLKEITDV